MVCQDTQGATRFDISSLYAGYDKSYPPRTSVSDVHAPVFGQYCPFSVLVSETASSIESLGMIHHVRCATTNH
jgi:hypothetical protein